ncbi:alpha/beta hydrolase [Nocardiopsis sp. HNM0947]|uniref:Alpha/beta hydrolase n=1 Tax=Nocardiopsis coralli TaxID=2772213 RepID=A0ABR9PEH7_9ACTN|nr:alpha/beta hydrolase [Nocardiopsis coralli]MBE3002242.1 alpha/beta hydrolase [Nocardiopsis coralli]
MSVVERRHPSGPTLPALCAALVLATGTAAAPQAAPGSDPDRRGEPYSVAEIEGTPGLPGAAHNYLVTYGSTGVSGSPVTVSGTIALPPGEPPEEGWPVVGWAHGTTGVSDLCAPSADRPGGPAHEYLSTADAALDPWLEHGYAVVRADFEGLGTPGPHPYLNGTGTAHTVADLVTAAQHVDGRVGGDWIALGHSQGGHAALFAADGDRSGAAGPQSRPLGVVSAAPGGMGVSALVQWFREADPEDEHVVAALPFLPVLLLGAEAAEPSVDAEALLTEEVRPLLEAARTGCMDDIAEAARDLSADTLFEEDARTTELEDYLRSQEPHRLEPDLPALVVQGTEDELVPAEDTEELVAALAERTSAELEYRTYEGADHRGVLEDSFDDALAFAERLREGSGR